MFNILDLETGQLLTEDNELIVLFKGEHATKYCEILQLQHGHKFQPRRVKVEGDWRARERAKYGTGEYILPEFLAEYNQGDYFLHISKNGDRLLAYIQSVEKGEHNIQSKISLRTFMQKYTNASSKKVDDLERKFFEYLDSRVELKIAMDPEEIVRVYTNYDRSCSQVSKSCMVSSDYKNLPHHPVYAYGGGDLGVAYLTNPAGETTHRAIVWPEKKVYSRVYGDNDHLHRILNAKGYGKSSRYYPDGCGRSLHGAKLLTFAVEPGCFLLPYIDENVAVDILNKSSSKPTIVLDINGHVNPRSQAGVYGELRNPYLCKNCNTRTRNVRNVRVGVGRTIQNWCDNCSANQAFRCVKTDAWYKSSEYKHVKLATGHIWLKTCFERDGFTCVKTGLNWPLSEKVAVRISATEKKYEHWSVHAAKLHGWRNYDGEYFSKEVEPIKMQSTEDPTFEVLITPNLIAQLESSQFITIVSSIET
jgi:hypothetical protein